jgi:phenylacetate-CoA ligase
MQVSPEVAGETAEWLLERALSWASKTTYGQRFGSSLNDWPVLTKSDLLASPAEFKRRWRLAIPAATGGSTGRPLRLWRSLECIAAEQAAVDSLFGDEARPMLQQRVAVLRADYVKDPADSSPPFGIYRNKGRWLILSNAHLTGANFRWFVDAISSFKPDILWVYPTALSNLLRLAERAGVNLSVPTVLSSSEMMGEALFVYARETLQARVIDLYGQGERVCSAHCNSSREYRFNRAYGHVELIPEPRDLSAGTPITARIVATGYWNSAFPLVRYDTGDRAILPASCASGSLERIEQGLQPFLGIIGRADDYIVGRDAERITGMNHIPRELDDVLQIQIVQDSTTRVRILVLSKDDLTIADRRQLEQNARELLPPYMELHIEATDRLLALPNGKSPFIIRRPELSAHV